MKPAGARRRAWWPPPGSAIRRVFLRCCAPPAWSLTKCRLPDHYPFADDPFAFDTADIILITEKDAVKCSRHPALKNDPRLWVVPVTARIDEALAEHILEKLRGYPTA